MEWLSPWKLTEHAADYWCGGDFRKIERHLHRWVVRGRARARYRGEILGPDRLQEIASKRWGPPGDPYALPADIEINVDDAERLYRELPRLRAV